MPQFEMTLPPTTAQRVRGGKFKLGPETRERVLIEPDDLVYPVDEALAELLQQTFPVLVDTLDLEVPYRASRETARYFVTTNAGAIMPLDSDGLGYRDKLQERVPPSWHALPRLPDQVPASALLLGQRALILRPALVARRVGDQSVFGPAERTVPGSMQTRFDDGMRLVLLDAVCVADDDEVRIGSRIVAPSTRVAVIDDLSAFHARCNGKKKIAEIELARSGHCLIDGKHRQIAQVTTADRLRGPVGTPIAIWSARHKWEYGETL